LHPSAFLRVLCVKDFERLKKLNTEKTEKCGGPQRNPAAITAWISNGIVEPLIRRHRRFKQTPVPHAGRPAQRPAQRCTASSEACAPQKKLLIGRKSKAPEGRARGRKAVSVTLRSLGVKLGESAGNATSSDRRSGFGTAAIHPARTLLGKIRFAKRVLPENRVL
jgi:hypothetical protein